MSMADAARARDLETRVAALERRLEQIDKATTQRMDALQHQIDIVRGVKTKNAA